MKTEIESSIRDAEHHRDTARNNLHNVLVIVEKIEALRIRQMSGCALSGALADAVEEANKAALYDLEITSLEYRVAVYAVQDAYAGDGTEQ